MSLITTDKSKMPSLFTTTGREIKPKQDKDIPDVSSWFDRVVSQSVPAVSTVTLLTVVVPSAAKFILDKFANYVSDTGAWGNVQWEIRRNGVTVAPYGLIKDQLGQPNLPRDMYEDAVFDGGQTITFVATNNHATTAYLMGVSVQGRFVRK